MTVVILRRLVVHAKAQIQRQPAVYLPVVLNVFFEVLIDNVKRLFDVVLVVAVDVAEQRVGKTVIGIEQRIGGGRSKVERAGVIFAGALILGVELNVDTSL